MFILLHQTIENTPQHMFQSSYHFSKADKIIFFTTLFLLKQNIYISIGLNELLCNFIKFTEDINADIFLLIASVSLLIHSPKFLT